MIKDKDKSRIQSCVDHINTAVDVDPWAKELVAEMGKEILKAQLSGEGTTSDCISRRGAIDICNNVIDLWQGQLGEGALVAIKNAINNLPSVQPTYTDAEVQKMQDMHQVEIEKAFELGMEDAKPEIMPDGTLHVTVNADVANIDRILLTQAGTHSGDIYYKDDEQPERKTGQWLPTICNSDGMHHEWCGFHCSLCNQATVIRYKFCPNCGAHMRIKKEGEQE